MIGQDHYFGAQGNTTLHLAVLLALVTASSLIYFLPRRYVLAPLIAGSLFVPNAQQIMVAGLHLTVFRILLLCAWMRVLMTRAQEGQKAFKWNRLDTVFLVYCLANAATYSIKWANTGALVN